MKKPIDLHLDSFVNKVDMLTPDERRFISAVFDQRDNLTVKIDFIVHLSKLEAKIDEALDLKRRKEFSKSEHTYI